MNLIRTRLEQAVVSVYSDIEQRALSSKIVYDERILWREFSCCILSSQVPYPLSVAAAEAIDRSGLLLSENTGDAENKLTSLLKTPLTVGGSTRLYRFPGARARQLSLARQAVIERAGTLEGLLSISDDPRHIRSWLVANAPGMGPKQASMFLRNSAISYDLAILDRHVLEFMAEMGLVQTAARSISRISEYHKREDSLRSYANGLGAAVGLIDWAIWIVMRMFKQFGIGRVAA